MKAAIYTKFGPPSVVFMSNMPMPVPKSHEILIRIHASTVSTADWRARSLEMPAGFGLFARPVFGFVAPRQPILGTELAGEVIALGEAVTRFRVGDQVFAFTGAKLGCHAEYRTIPESGLVMHKPANLSFEAAAALSFGGTTALYFLQARGGVRTGDSVLILGASGCIGSAAVQLAVHFGAQVTGVCSAAHMDLVRSLGAHAVIDYATQDFTATDQTYDTILDTAGVAPHARCGRLLKPGGRLLVVQGTLGQTVGLGGLSASNGRRSIGGVAKVEISHLKLLADLAATGAFKPVIDRCYPLAQAAEAHAYVAGGHKVGSVVLTVAPVPHPRPMAG